MPAGRGDRGVAARTARPGRAQMSNHAGCLSAKVQDVCSRRNARQKRTHPVARKGPALTPVSFFILLISNPRRTPLTHRGWHGRF